MIQRQCDANGRDEGEAIKAIISMLVGSIVALVGRYRERLSRTAKRRDRERGLQTKLYVIDFTADGTGFLGGLASRSVAR
jgi:hypothetical protein